MLIEDLFSLKGKTAIVIGGGGVLGGEIALGFAAAGADVVIADLNEENAKKRAEAICRQGKNSVVCQADVTSKADLQRVLEAAMANFGGVDILLNAAGINSGTPFFEIGESEWERILDVDLRSVFLACQVFGKVMVDANKGGIDHQYLVGILGPATVEGIHVFGGQGRSESGHQVPCA